MNKIPWDEENPYIIAEIGLNHNGSISDAKKLCYLAREELVKLRKKCVTTKFNKKTRQPEEDLDEERFLVEYCKAVIKSWSGLKYRYLEELLLVDISKLDPDFYIGACHKWLCSPKGASFLYVKKELQDNMEPHIKSWGWGSEYSEFKDTTQHKTKSRYRGNH